MKTKKLAALALAALVCMAFAGCGLDSAINKDLPEGETASPTETPKEGVEAVFGKPVTIAIVSDSDEAASALFFDAAVREAKSMGIDVITKAGGGAFDTAVNDAAKDADAVVVFLSEAAGDYSAIIDCGKPVTVFESQKGDVPDGLSHLYYEPDGELDLAFQAALTYPPHETPVRMILLFESRGSTAYEAYQKLYDEGKIFPKQIYFADEAESSAGDWLTETLNGYIEGMLDAVFAENTALAANAFDTLAALDRTDMEVFCPGVNQDVITRMKSSPDVFPQAVGRNDALAGVLSVRAALISLQSGQTLKQALVPVLQSAAELGEDGLQSGSELFAPFAADFMDTLRSYYSAAEGA